MVPRALVPVHRARPFAQIIVAMSAPAARATLAMIAETDAVGHPGSCQTRNWR